MTERRFVKLKKSNDWGHTYYVAPDRFGSSYGTFSIASDGVSWHHLVGSEVAVRWADGTEGTAKVVVDRDSSTVSDHGHEYRVNSEFPALVVTHHGDQMKIALESVDVLYADWARGPASGEGGE